MKKFLLLVLLLAFGISYADDIKIVTKEIKDSSETKRYEVRANYPQIEGLKDKGIQDKINKYIFTAASDNLKNFITDMSDWEIPKDLPDVYSYMEIDFESYTLNEDVFSFAFQISSYYAGAAHPNHWTNSMNWDLKKGTFIAFKDLFKPDSKYLEKISAYCIEDLKLQAKINDYEFFEDMLYDGAGSRDSNFVNYNLVQKGLQITFDPYTVAPYVLGTQYVILPYRAVFEMMDDEILNLIPNF
jgi:hypothetical protein